MRVPCNGVPWRSMAARLVATLAVLALGAMVSPARAGTALTRVRLSEVVRSVFYAPQYVAFTQGFFGQEGLEVELTTAQGADKGMAALLSGSADIGFFGPEAAVYVYQRGAPDHAVGFAQLTRRDGSFLMARRPSSTFQWSEVRGKTIVGARKGGVPEMVLEWILRRNGIDPHKDVHIITNLAFEAAPGAFEAGTGDYLAQFEPAMTAMESRGIGKIVASLGVDGGEITYTVYHARKSYIEQHPDIIERFTRAIYRGQLWVESHSITEIADAVAPFFPAMDRAILERSLQRYRDQGTWPVNPTISRQGFDHLLEVMESAGELQSRVPFDAIMTNQFAERATRALSTSP